MRAAVLKGWGQPIAVEDIPRPEPGPGELLVRIKASGVCHTDIEQWRGYWPEIRAAMEATGVKVLGHEGVGVVEEVGLGVTRFRKGDRVGIGFLNYFCGSCEYCLNGDGPWCQNGRSTTVHVNGTHAEYAVVHERAAPRIPKELTDVEAAPLMDAGVTVYSALKRLVREAHVQPTKPIAVVGAAGGLGHYAVQIAKAFGYTVVGVDVGEERVRFVERLGTDYAVDAKDAERFVADRLGGVYAALVVTNTVSGYGLALRLLRPRGVLVGVGNPPVHEGHIPISPTQANIRGIRYLGTIIGVAQEIEELLALAAAGKVKSHIAKTAPLDQINQVFRELEERRYVGRAVLLP